MDVCHSSCIFEICNVFFYLLGCLNWWKMKKSVTLVLRKDGRKDGRTKLGLECRMHGPNGANRRNGTNGARRFASSGQYLVRRQSDEKDTDRL